MYVNIHIYIYVYIIYIYVYHIRNDIYDIYIYNDVISYIKVLHIQVCNRITWCNIVPHYFNISIPIQPLMLWTFAQSKEYCQDDVFESESPTKSDMLHFMRYCATQG